jgi:hypothetical protein
MGSSGENFADNSQDVILTECAKDDRFSASRDKPVGTANSQKGLIRKDKGPAMSDGLITGTSLEDIPRTPLGPFALNSSYLL